MELPHDAGVRIGTMLDVTRTAEELADVAARRFADFAAVDLPVSVLLGDEPEPLGPGTRLRRVALGAMHEESHLYEVGDLVGPGPAGGAPSPPASTVAVGNNRTSHSAGATAQSTGNGQRKPYQPGAPDPPRGTAPSLNGERRLRHRRHGGQHPTAAPHRGPGDATDPRFTQVLAAFSESCRISTNRSRSGPPLGR
ncbi:hypothetical protein E4N62_32910 [Streptomyces sp. MNU76]|uniref:hypothetical protein n=1 Tax=Streptomyces sp. MNU76 TaxID=2560026 RepID=UPI001E418906|nr:hypothetical protein [Streptomyces sp. MNU76]MCC9709641.1 hypothetical protein [Streptomyces sp. MNU76]